MVHFKQSSARFIRNLAFLSLLFTLHSYAYVIHIKSPFSGSNLFIYGSNEFGWESSATSMTSEGNGWFSVTTSDNSSTSSLTLSDAVTWPKSTVSLGSIGSLFSGSSSATEVWIVMSTSGVVSKSFTDPDGTVDPKDTTIIIERPDSWNDSARVFVIWNRGAHSNVDDETRDYVLNAIAPISNIVTRSGNDSDWETIAADLSLGQLKSKFRGNLPHVIVYINSGWIWDDLATTKSTSPYELIKAATDSGIGVVAIGDDAAWDGQYIFPMTGPDGTGSVQNSDGLMGAATQFDSLWVWLNPEENDFLPDGGLLWNVDADTLFFITTAEGRFQADADRWAIDTTWLHNYSFLGFQQGWSSSTGVVHSDPYYYKSISALQQENQRIAMLSYEPQFIRDKSSSSQIIYNSIYWASKAHEMLQIPTPVADPDGNTFSDGENITLSVALHNSSLYKLYYTTNGSEPSTSSNLYSGSISTVALGDNFTIKAKAFATNTADWIDSDVMVENYTANTRVISAIIRDQAADGVEFQGGATGHKTGMVQDTLSSNGKLLKGSVDAKSANLESWFVDKNDNDTCIYMVWEKSADGYWEYNSNDYGGFFPIDNFNHANNSVGTFGHNFHFTMEIHTQFVYKEGSAQVFEFSGDDDVWVFINNKLAIDIGGIHGPVSGSVNLDNSKSTLGLKNGENYALDIFFCERQTSGSNFRARTSIDIYNDVNIFYDSVNVSATEIIYDIHEYDIVESELCGFNINNPDADTVAASVDFFLEGSQLGNKQEHLTVGLNYNGIKVIGDSAVSIDTSIITGLTPGTYTIKFISKTDFNLSGEIKFTISEEIILTKATLNVTPGDTIYSDTSIKVSLSTNSGNTIVYELLSFDSVVLIGPDTIDVAGTVTVIGDMILKATASGNGYEDNTGVWYYDSEIPQLELKSSLLNGSQFQNDTAIYLHAEVDGDTIDNVLIYYMVDSVGSSEMPDSVTGTLYSENSGIKLFNSASIHAVVYKSGYIQGINSWNYKLDLLDINITVSPSDSAQFYFGESIKKITISTDQTNNVAVSWIMDTVPHKDYNDFKNNGNNYNELSNYPSINNNDNDTMYLSVMASGLGYDTTLKIYKYVRLYLPKITADHYSSEGYGFNEELSVALSIYDPDELFENLQIYYVVTSDTTVIADSNDNEYGNDIDINITSYIKAIAYADNAVTSPSFMGYYILATRSGGAWYKDLNGNGLIDAASIKLNNHPISIPDSLTVYPDSLHFINPFDLKDTITAIKDSITLDGDYLEIKFSEEMYSGTDIITVFENGLYGCFYGKYYSDSLFSIDDSVAPVLTRAIYVPGTIYQNGDSLVKNNDTLLAIFSEPVLASSINDLDKSRFFNLNSNSSEEYYFDLSFYKLNKNGAHFIVDSVVGVPFPSDGDSINIWTGDSIASENGNVVQTNDKNRYCTLEVMSISVEPYVKAISPVSPDKYVIPELLKGDGITFETGMPFVIDFLIPLSNDIMQKLDARIVIYDQLGHVLAHCDGIDKGKSKNIEISMISNESTKLVIVWDGTNSSGRLVSSGSYAVELFFKSLDNEVWHYRKLFIGVKN